MKTVNVKEKGAALVEFALAAMLFLTVLFAIIEFSYLFWANLTMQHAVREAARYAVVTSPVNFPKDSTCNLSVNPPPAVCQARYQAKLRCYALVDKIIANSMGVYGMLKPSPPTIEFSTVNASGVPTYQGNDCAAAAVEDSIGVQGTIVMIKLIANIDLLTPLMMPFFPNKQYTFTVSATMKNEAF